MFGLGNGEYQAQSHNNLWIRLTSERWEHIIEGHPELTESLFDILRAVNQPDRIYAGNNGELLAVKEVESGKWLVVAYRESRRNVDTTPYDEIQKESFIITAFLTRRIRSLERRQQLL